MAFGLGARRTMVVLFFFSSRRRHTRFDCDWSSDVCSSDLRQISCSLDLPLLTTSTSNDSVASLHCGVIISKLDTSTPHRIACNASQLPVEIGRASCRERV